MNFNLTENTILLTLAGSRVYGMQTPESDLDVKGVAIPPKQYYFGFLNRFEQADKPTHMMEFYSHFTNEEKALADAGMLEGSIYDLRKFIDLAQQCNPNILDALFCRDKEVRYINKFGEILRDNKDLFISKKIKYTMMGYSWAQLKRIKTHRSWLLEPPKKEPTRSDFKLHEMRQIPGEQLKAVEASIQKKMDTWNLDLSDLDSARQIYIQEQLRDYMVDLHLGANDLFPIAAKSLGYDSNFIELLLTKRAYDNAHQHWKQYLEWKKNRNPMRAELERKYGFDGKHGSHLVRLIKMCREVLETGVLNIYRPDAEELLDIRRGKWTYDELMEFVDREEKVIEELYPKSTLPHSPNREKIDALCIDLVSRFLEK